MPDPLRNQLQATLGSAGTPDGSLLPRDRRPLPMTRRAFCGAAARVAAGAALAPVAACDVRAFAYRHGAKRRLSIAAGNTGGVYYVYGGAIARVVGASLPRVEMTAEVTGGSVDNLHFLARGTADLGFALADTLADAVHHRGPFARSPTIPVRSMATLYTQPVHLVTFADTGIARLADLRGRLVAVGSPGGGSEVAAARILRSAGIDPDRDLRRERLGFAASAEAIKDGKIDAVFISAGAPNSAVLDLANVRGRAMRLVSTLGVLPALQREFGAAAYRAVRIPGGTYPGLHADVDAVGHDTVLVADERLHAGVAYDITRLLFDRRADLAAVHPLAAELSPGTASAPSPVPYHPGAIRYYREVGVWRE